MAGTVAGTLAGAAGAGPRPRPARGLEHQRRADLGDGRYLNPIVPGDRPDPTVLRVGRDYYLTFSSFDACPGVWIWHSRDLVCWAPLAPAITRPVGSVWACDLVHHGGRFYVYLPAMRPGGSAILVVHAEDPRGPWSEPVDLGIADAIDPGHVVGEDGRRYLFVNGIRRIALRDDGLATAGPLEHACTPWRYPEDWVVEMFAPEGPKLFWHQGWLYMVAAVGGTAGPATSHMVTLARSRSVHGPWEHAPNNPVVRTRSAAEPWWSRGHASVVQGPAGDWWMIYHGYENGLRTLGRQTLMEPVRWTRDGWLEALGGRLDRPLRRPAGGTPGPDGLPLSDDFAGRLGPGWSLAGDDGRTRLGFEPGGGLVLQGRGKGLPDSGPLACIPPDRSYEASVELQVLGEGQGGLVLWYGPRAFAGFGFSRTQMLTWGHGEEHPWMREPAPAGPLRLRLRNRENVLTLWHAAGDGPWRQHPWQMEVSGLHHNVFGGFVGLRIALYAAGPGAVRFRRFRYQGLEDEA